MNHRRLAVCRRCPQRPTCRKLFAQDATCEHWPSDQAPGILTLATRATGEIIRWAKSGAKLVSDEVFAARLAICAACPHWDKDGNLGLGRCKHPQCGCTRAKHRLATSACPMGQWLPVQSDNPTS